MVVQYWRLIYGVGKRDGRLRIGDVPIPDTSLFLRDGQVLFRQQAAALARTGS